MSADRTPTRIALVDDHPLVRDGLKMRLSSQPGLTVVAEADNAQAALALVATEAPDLVLMDVGMKGTNGIDLTAELRRLHPGVRVLMLSMYDNPEYVNRAMQAGASGYVLKDAPSGDILEAIAAIVEGRTYLSAAVAGRSSRSHAPRPVLSLRESQIMGLLSRGQSSRQIAEALGLSVRTVETHRHNIKRKLGLEGQAELIKYAVEHCRDETALPAPAPRA